MESGRSGVVTCLQTRTEVKRSGPASVDRSSGSWHTLAIACACASSCTGFDCAAACCSRVGAAHAGEAHAKLRACLPMQCKLVRFVRLEELRTAEIDMALNARLRLQFVKANVISMSSLPGGTRGIPNLGEKVYSAMQRFMPWSWTGIFSTPEFKSHIPVVSQATRSAPASPPYRASQSNCCASLPWHESQHVSKIGVIFGRHQCFVLRPDPFGRS